MATTHIVLASQSPRRQALLKRIVDNFIIDSPDIDEAHQVLPANRLSYELSRLKAYEVFRRHPQAIILAADTIVVIEGKILNKPQNRTEARQMLLTLSNREHQVLTSYTIMSATKEVSRTIKTRVQMKEIDATILEAYLDTTIPYDKAGAYAIQENAPQFQFVAEIKGEYENVMGLPIKAIARDLLSFGVPIKTPK